MGIYTFKEDEDTGLKRYRNGEYDGLANNPEYQLWFELQRTQAKLSDDRPMRVSSFDTFVVRPAANGVIVEDCIRPDQASNPIDVNVFTCFTDFIDWVRTETQMPEDGGNNE